ncbi:HU family DNA-binding protein, partial [Escherichia sp. SS-MK2]
MTKTQASLAVDAVLESIQHALQNGEHVQLLGFGTFEVRASPVCGLRPSRAARSLT